MTWSEPGPSKPDRRHRVVLAEVRPKRRLRVADSADRDSRLADEAVRRLIRRQLWLAIRLAIVVALVFGLLPVAYAVFPEFARARVFGIGLPWLLLGFGAYPLLLAIGWAFVTRAERNERAASASHRRDERSGPT